MSRPVSEARLISTLTTTNALNFNAATTTPTVTIPKHTSFDSLTSLTLEAWINLGALPAAGYSVFDYLAATKGYSLRVNTTGTFGFRTANGTTETIVASVQKVKLGSWTHVAMTWDGTTVRGFVDGILSVNTGALTGNTGVVGDSAYIGNRFGNATAFTGLIQEVRLSNTVRYTATFTVPTAPFTYDANTLALFHLDEGTGTTTIDSTPLAHVGTLSGTTLPLWSRGGLKKAGSTARLSVT